MSPFKMIICVCVLSTLRCIVLVYTFSVLSYFLDSVVLKTFTFQANTQCPFCLKHLILEPRTEFSDTHNSETSRMNSQQLRQYAQDLCRLMPDKAIMWRGTVGTKPHLAKEVYPLEVAGKRIR